MILAGLLWFAHFIKTYFKNKDVEIVEYPHFMSKDTFLHCHSFDTQQGKQLVHWTEKVLFIDAS